MYNVGKKKGGIVYIPPVTDKIWDWVLILAAIIGGGTLLGYLLLGLFVCIQEKLK
jgi:hypothetical protein